MRDDQMLLTPRDAARLLSLSERTLYSLRRRGELPAVQVGRAVRFDVTDLRAWIDQKKTAGRETGGEERVKDYGSLQPDSIKNN